MLRAEFSVVAGDADLLFGCLDSLRATLPPEYSDAPITVTCNRPGAELAARVAARYPGIRVIENTVPRGFAANHNAVLAESEAEIVWVLNDDLVILPGAIGTVMDWLAAPGQEQVAVVSPRLRNPDGSLQPSTYSFPTVPRMLLAFSGLRDRPWVEAALPRLARLLGRRPGTSRFWPHDRTVTVDTLRGACVAVRMAAVREVGLMTEVALVGGEETEWHRRFAEAGWKVVFLPDAEVMHYGSQTVGTDARYETEYLKGTLNFFRCWRSRPIYLAFRAAAAGLFALRWAAASLHGDRSAAARAHANVRTCLRPLRPPVIRRVRQPSAG